MLQREVWNIGVDIVISINADITDLELTKDIVDILKENNINIIKELTQKSKTKLKEAGLFNNQISEVEIKLQLQGFDLKTKY